MTILYEDQSITICIKLPGISSEDTKTADSVPGQLRLHWGRPDAYVGVVHRLDLGVGGVMVYARTPSAAAALSRQVADRTMEKEYLCLCAGVPSPAQGQMRDHLFKDSRSHKVFPVKKARKGAKEALLDYTVLAEGILSGAGVASVAAVDPHGTVDAALAPQGDMTGAADAEVVLSATIHSESVSPPQGKMPRAADNKTTPTALPLAPRGDTARAADAYTGVAAVAAVENTDAPRGDTTQATKAGAETTTMTGSDHSTAPKGSTPRQADGDLAPGALPLTSRGDTARAADAVYTASAAPQPVALCRVLLHTGRTHQIRVQFASRKHPLLGDGKYGSRIKGPIALQCSRIAFDHPKTGRRMEFALPAPEQWPIRGEDPLLF